MKSSRRNKRQKIQHRIRKHLKGTTSRPRLNVFRSNKEIYAQVIDDLNGHTLAAASSREDGIGSEGTKREQAKKVGKLIGDRAKSLNIESVVFDRAGYLYHGRVKSLAEGAREAGLKF